MSFAGSNTNSVSFLGQRSNAVSNPLDSRLCNCRPCCCTRAAATVLLRHCCCNRAAATVLHGPPHHRPPHHHPRPLLHPSSSPPPSSSPSPPLPFALSFILHSSHTMCTSHHSPLLCVSAHFSPIASLTQEDREGAECQARQALQLPLQQGQELQGNLERGRLMQQPTCFSRPCWQ